MSAENLTRRKFAQGLGLAAAFLASKEATTLALGGQPASVALLEALVSPKTYKDEIERRRRIKILDMTRPEGGYEYAALTRLYGPYINPVPWDTDQLTMLDEFLGFLPSHMYERSFINPLKVTLAEQGDGCDCDGVAVSGPLTSLVSLDTHMFTHQDLLRSFDTLVHELTHSKRYGHEKEDYQAISTILGGDFAEKRLEFIMRAQAITHFPEAELRDFRGDILYGLSKPSSIELIPTLAAHYTHGPDKFYKLHDQVFGPEIAEGLYQYIERQVFRYVEYHDGYPLNQSTNRQTLGLSLTRLDNYTPVAA